MYYKHGVRVEPEDGIVNNYSGNNESKEAPFALSLAFRTVNTQCSQAQCIASGLYTNYAKKWKLMFTVSYIV